MRRFGRKHDQRKALIKGLAQALILEGRIKTTLAKAKSLRPFVEKKITKAKRKDLSTRRYLLKFFAPKVVKKLIDVYGRRYLERQGGYTRIIKLPPRERDGADMALIEFV